MDVIIDDEYINRYISATSQIYQRSLTREEVSVAAVSGAIQFFKIGNFKESILMCEMAKRLDRKNCGAIHLMGEIHHWQGYYENAIEFFEGGLLICRNKDWECRFRESLGWIKWELGLYDESHKYLCEAQQLNPLLISIHIKIGRCYVRMQLWEQAFAAFLCGLALDPTDCICLSALVSLYSSCENTSLRNMEIAHSLTKKMLNASCERPVGCFAAAGMMCAALGDFIAARTYTEQAVIEIGRLQVNEFDIPSTTSTARTLAMLKERVELYRRGVQVCVQWV